MSSRMIVHVGMHKTGTSSIQDSLAAHLDAPGWRYVAFGRPNGSLAVRNAYVPPDAPTRAGGPDLTPEQVARGRVRGMRAITSALNALEDETGIVSAEVISTLPPADLAPFLDLLRRYRPDLLVVAYVRRPKSYAESAFQQQLKRELPRRQGGVLALRYRDTFTKFEALVGVDGLRLWPFDPPRLRGGDVVADFCHRLGIAFDPALSIRANEGLSLEATRLLYAYRLRHPRLQRGDAGMVRRLAALGGPRFHLHSSLYASLARTDPAQVAWAGERAGMDMAEDLAARDDVGIRSLDDLLRPGPAALDWLAAEAGVPASGLGSPEAVAEALERLRPPHPNPGRDPDPARDPDRDPARPPRTDAERRAARARRAAAGRPVPAARGGAGEGRAWDGAVRED